MQPLYLVQVLLVVLHHMGSNPDRESAAEPSRSTVPPAPASANVSEPRPSTTPLAPASASVPEPRVSSSVLEPRGQQGTGSTPQWIPSLETGLRTLNLFGPPLGECGAAQVSHWLQTLGTVPA